MRRRTLVAGALLCGVAGCGSSQFDLVPVSGVVTLDGEPLAGGVINFQPNAPAGQTTGGPGSSSHTDDEGRFEMETIQGEPGAVVGTHKVRIYSFSPETPIASDSDAGPSKERVPHRYNYRSELTFEVPVGGTDAADFKLTTAEE
ncbi:MAG: hypothetical protein AAF961_13680 [Planctomycetota bacterium]